MAPLSAPVLSAYDPLTSAEGSIDPLGLASTYERLADAILPGITVRMRRPRFLTAIAVGAYVCSDLPSDTLAKDSVSPPWQGVRVVDRRSPRPLRRTVAGTWWNPWNPEGAKRSQQQAATECRCLSAGAQRLRLYRRIYRRRLARRTRVLTTQGMLDDAGHRLARGVDG